MLCVIVGDPVPVLMRQIPVLFSNLPESNVAGDSTGGPGCAHRQRAFADSEVATADELAALPSSSSWEKLSPRYADLLLTARHFRLEGGYFADQGLDPSLQVLSFVSVFSSITLQAIDNALCGAEIAFCVAKR